MEEEGKNGIPSNAIVVHRKLRIKKRTGLQAIWAAILLRFKFRVSKKTSIAVAPKLDKKEDTIEFPTNSETTWKDIVGGIRPLHMLQQLEYRSYASLPPPPPPPHFDKETYHDVSLPPSSPARSYDGMSSRYCSAEDLHALDKDGAVDEEGGSDVINSQADEFIAKFYEQIRLQRLQLLNET